MSEASGAGVVREVGTRDAFGVRSYPVDLEAARGAKLYVARLEVDDRGGLNRDWLKGRYLKTRRVLEFGPAAIGAGNLPAWLVRRPRVACPTCFQPRQVKDCGEELIAAFDSGWINYGLVFGTVDLLNVLEAGAPGSSGAWAGARCSRCEVSPVLEGVDVCAGCESSGTASAHLAATSDLAVAF